MNVKAKQNNLGFTLIELLISIAILAIVLLPLLNNFVAAAKINAKSKRMQNETILAQNMLEEVKSLKVGDLAARFNYPDDFSPSNGIVNEMVIKNGNLVPALVDEFSSIRHSAGDGTYSYKFIERQNQPYYFAKKNITMGGRKYDALITLDQTEYMEGNTTGETAYNSFLLPVFSDLDTINNLLVLQEAETEDLAINELLRNQINYNVALLKSNPKATPVYNTQLEVKNKLKKEIQVSITNPYNTNVNFVYTAPGITGAGSAIYTLGDKILDVTKGSVYIFYFPSTENSLTIQKDSQLTLPVDIYAIGQDPSSDIGRDLTIKDNIIPKGIHIYSNSSQIKNLTGGNDLVKKDKAKNRIYKVHVQLFTPGSNFSNNGLCAEFTSTKED